MSKTGVGRTADSAVQLSPRELEVSRLVAEGLTNREIASRLFLSERTVDGHLEHIREKLGVSTRAQVTAWVVRNETASVAAPLPSVHRARLTFAHPRAWMAVTLVLAMLAAAVGLLRLTQAPPPIIEAFAGSDCPQPDTTLCIGDGSRASAAYLARPTSIAFDSKGDMYIADYEHRRIRVVRNGIISTVVGGGDQDLHRGVFGQDVSSDSIGHASAVAVGADDELYILTDRSGELEIWRMDAFGFIYPFASLGPSHVTFTDVDVNLPVGGLAITKGGMVFASDRAGDRVVRVSGGNVYPYAGGGANGLGDRGAATSAQLSWPIGLALDRQGDLYIADTGHHRIRKVDHATEIISTVAGSGMYEGNSGDSGPAVHAQLSFPYGLAVAGDGTIVVADTGNNRLREVSKDGTISALAGTGRWGFWGDGLPALDGELDGPESVVIDSKGDLFIADTENQRIREMPMVVAPA